MANTPKTFQNKIKELKEKLQQKEKAIYSIERIGRALSSTLDLDELLNLIMREITVLMNAERSTLFLVDRQRGEIWSKIALEAEVAEIRQKLGKGISGHVAKTGEPINIADAYRDKRFDPTTDKKTGYTTRSILCFPVWEPLSPESNREIMGVIQVLNKRDGIFRKEDEVLLETLASQVAISISNSRLYRRLENKYQEVDALYEFEKIISSFFTLPELLESLLGKTLVHLQAVCIFAIFRFDSKIIFTGIDKEQNYIYKDRSKVPSKVKLFIHNPQIESSTEVWPLLQEVLDIKEKVSTSRKAVLLSPIRLNNLKEGVLIVFGGNTKNPGELGDAQKLTDLVAQKISRALELQNLRQDLLKKEQLSVIGQMMSTIVHDLRSPINTIYGFIDLMESEQTSDEERIEFAEIIRQEIKAVLTMTTEILDFATGKTSILPRKSSVRDVMKRFLPALEEMCRKTNTEFIMNDSSLALLYVDEEKLVRVFQNITKNALEAMGSGGKLQLDILDEAENVIFIFKDNGPGIPAEIENKLFDSFVSSGKETGTGLGLAIVKKIIDEHNGVVEIDSVAGKGTTVRIKLPIYQSN